MMLLDDNRIEPFILDNFKGGMRMNDDATKLGADEYFFLSNGRVRNNKVVPIKLPLRDSTIPAGTIQSIIGAGSILTLMIAGRFYYKDFATMAEFSIPGSFSPMDAVMPVYGALVPSSTSNFLRKLDSPDVTGSLSLTDIQTASPRCLVLQNRFERPRLVFSDGSSRLANDIPQWSVDDREYVPTGGIMLYHEGDGTLYIVSPDGTEVYRSVGGRPLDFVIAINGAGDRLRDGLYTVEASRLSHRVGFNVITTLKTLNYKSDFMEENPPFFVGTETGSNLVFPHVDELLYGEPGRYHNVPLFPTGPRNNFSFIDMLGDYGFISPTGIHSFNAISIFQNEGKNSPFYIEIAPLFEGVSQDTVCAAEFDNYALFAVNTKFGRGILVFDPIIRKFVSLDIYPGVGQIKQFAEIVVAGKRRLFFYDTNNNLYEAFTGPTAEMLFYPREWKTNYLRLEHKVAGIQIALSNIQENGSVVITDYSDGKKGKSITKPLQRNTPVNVLPTTAPYGAVTSDVLRTPTIAFDFAKRGWKIGIELRLNCNAELQELQVMPDVIPEQIPESEGKLVNAS